MRLLAEDSPSESVRYPAFNEAQRTTLATDSERASLFDCVAARLALTS